MKIALAHPELAPLLLAAVLIVALCAVALVRRRRALAAFAGTGARLASASPARQVTKLILVGALTASAILVYRSSIAITGIANQPPFTDYKSAHPGASR